MGAARRTGVNPKIGRHGRSDMAKKRREAKQRLNAEVMDMRIDGNVRHEMDKALRNAGLLRYFTDNDTTHPRRRWLKAGCPSLVNPEVSKLETEYREFKEKTEEDLANTNRLLQDRESEIMRQDADLTQCQMAVLAMEGWDFWTRLKFLVSPGTWAFKRFPHVFWTVLDEKEDTLCETQ